MRLGDPYADQCRSTAAFAGAQAPGLARRRVAADLPVALCRARWLEPCTQPTLERLAAGLTSVDVLCPGFAADRLETLEEINMEVRGAFLHAGGKRFAYIPCLNDNRGGSPALSSIAQTHLAGWTAPAAKRYSR